MKRQFGMWREGRFEDFLEILGPEVCGRDRKVEISIHGVSTLKISTMTVARLNPGWHSIGYGTDLRCQGPAHA
jgi:hypothetical protein